MENPPAVPAVFAVPAQPVGPPATHPHYPLWSGALAPGPYRQAAAPTGAVAAQPKAAAARPLRPRELLAAAAVPILVDVAAWAHGDLALGGLGLALLFAALPALLFAAVSRRRASPQLAVVAALLVLVALRSLYLPSPLLVLLGVGLLTAFGLALRSRRTFVPEIALAATLGHLRVASRASAALRGVRKLLPRSRLSDTSLLPVLVPAGLVVVFACVFALANPLVADGLGRAWHALASLVALPSMGRVLLWASAAALGVSLLRPAYRSATRIETKRDHGEASGVSLAVARNALVTSNVLFLAYNAVDARYLWAGSPPDGMDTQHYAHAGAFWLTVALLLLTAVIGVMFRGPLASDPRANDARWLAYAWVAQGLVLALGTYRRIAIHIGSSGLSDLRIVGILGTTLVVCGVVLVLLKLRGQKTLLWLVRRQLDAFVIGAVLYAVVPTHLLSATVNVARVTSGEYRPILHAFRQSHETESAAALLPLLDHSDVRVRQGVAALLADERELLRATANGRRSWRERDVATRLALAELDANAERIDDALGGVDPNAARAALLRLSHEVNDPSRQ